MKEDTIINKYNSIMVIVPHQDDEILMTAGVIRHAVSAGIRVDIVMATNGDCGCRDFSAGRARLKESLAGIRLLGLSDENLHILGYADTGMPASESFLTHLYEEKDGKKLYPSLCSTCTYGLPDKPEYHMQRYGSHADYCRDSFKADLKEIIIEKLPDCIFTTSEFDMHGDHSALFHFVCEVLDEIGKEQGRGSSDEIGKEQGRGSSDEIGKEQGRGSSDEIGKEQGRGSSDEIGKEQGRGSSDEIGKEQGRGSSDEIGKEQERGSSDEIGKEQERNSSDEVKEVQSAYLPDIYTGIVHSNAGDDNWPKKDTALFSCPQGFDEETGLVFEERVSIPVPEEMAFRHGGENLKYRALLQYETALEPGAYAFLMSFIKEEEIFWKVR